VRQTVDDPPALILGWDGLMQMDGFATVFPHQRVNKIPGMDAICYKTSFFPDSVTHDNPLSSLYSFFLMTFQLPQQFGDFQREHMRLCEKSIGMRGDVTWILKPKNGCCGNGIHLVQNPFDLARQTELAVVQRYVEPYLINGSKFDFRFYVLIATLEPLTIYLSNEALARFCTRPCSPLTPETLSDRYCHHTNPTVKFANADRAGPILELASAVLAKLGHSDGRAAHVWPRIRDSVLLAFVAQNEGMIQNVGLVTAEGRQRFPPPGPLPDMRRYFHIIGIDVRSTHRPNGSCWSSMIGRPCA
jgi:hypothetical protein